MRTLEYRGFFSEQKYEMSKEKLFISETWPSLPPVEKQAGIPHMMATTTCDFSPISFFPFPPHERRKKQPEPPNSTLFA